MTDEAKALVERLRWSHWYYEDAGENTSYTSEAPLEAADLIETQAREIERLRAVLDNIAHESSDTWARRDACVALGIDWPETRRESHDQ